MWGWSDLPPGPFFMVLTQPPSCLAAQKKFFTKQQPSLTSSSSVQASVPSLGTPMGSAAGSRPFRLLNTNSRPLKRVLAVLASFSAASAETVSSSPTFSSERMEANSAGFKGRPRRVSSLANCETNRSGSDLILPSLNWARSLFDSVLLSERCLVAAFHCAL